MHSSLISNKHSDRLTRVYLHYFAVIASDSQLKNNRASQTPVSKFKYPACGIHQTYSQSSGAGVKSDSITNTTFLLCLTSDPLRRYSDIVVYLRTTDTIERSNPSKGLHIVILCNSCLVFKNTHACNQQQQSLKTIRGSGNSTPLA